MGIPYRLCLRKNPVPVTDTAEMGCWSFIVHLVERLHDDDLESCF